MPAPSTFVIIYAINQCSTMRECVCALPQMMGQAVLFSESPELVGPPKIALPLCPVTCPAAFAPWTPATVKELYGNSSYGNFTRWTRWRCLYLLKYKGSISRGRGRRNVIFKAIVLRTLWKVWSMHRIRFRSPDYCPSTIGWAQPFWQDVPDNVISFENCALKRTQQNLFLYVLLFDNLPYF